MTASFGCLDRQTLHLGDGLNTVVLANERGKSTWAAFVLAMFYGIDTAQRAAKGRLPDKIRYQPWNGMPMEGTMVLQWQGRRLVLQRTSARGKPMGLFRAYDPDTGLDVPELTAENCGLKLLGVEKEVFRRTAFLRGSELTVTREEDLTRRLAALAASGDMEESYPAAAERLKNWKNRLRRSLIPQTQAKIEARSRLQTDRETLLAQQTRLQQQIAALEAEQTSVPKERNISLFLLLLVMDLVLMGITASKSLWMPVILSVALLAVIVILYYVNNKRNQKIRLLRQQAQSREAHLRQLQTELAVTGARLADLPREDGDSAGELEELLFREQALTLAMEALDQAQTELEQGYGPRLTALAGQYLNRLTLGRYDGLVLDRELRLELRESASGLTRPLEALSSGTRDQAWLALRLAMTRLLLPEDAPMVLDDALVTFDDDRTAAALSLLAEEDRQILLLSCREL
jgi:uncharacterized protein YhaN